jgi:hypothetical protein
MADLDAAVVNPREAVVSDDVEQIFRFALDDWSAAWVARW